VERREDLLEFATPDGHAANGWLVDTQVVRVPEPDSQRGELAPVPGVVDDAKLFALAAADDGGDDFAALDDGTPGLVIVVRCGAQRPETR